MITVAQAFAEIGARSPIVPEEPVPLVKAFGRVTAYDVITRFDLPPFDNAAMDGFALKASARAGTALDVLGEAPAGVAQARVNGGAIAIMTGACVPEGYVTVVPVEQVDVLEADDCDRPRRIRVLNDARVGQHVRRRGEDIAVGTCGVAAGTLLKPQHLSLLAGMGEAQIKVRKRPRVALITTGAELVEDLSRPLEPGQIYNTHAILLAQRLRAAGAELVMQATVPDQSEAYILAMHHALDLGARVIVSTGAVSMGRYDFVPATLAALGAKIVFHKVGMRPGKPLLFAQLPDGALLFGLPGNPAAGPVGERFFVEASLRRMLGMATEQPWRLPLLDVARKRGGVRYFQKARLVVAGDGAVRVALLHGQDSFRLRTLAESTVWAVLPEEETELPAGTRVDVHALGHAESDLMGDMALCASA